MDFSLESLHFTIFYEDTLVNVLLRHLEGCFTVFGCDRALLIQMETRFKVLCILLGRSKVNM